MESLIYFKPFANVVAETVVKACMGGGRATDGKPDRISVLREILEERKEKWFALDEISRQNHWWTQSDVFYATRKRLLEYGYTDEEIDRDYITRKIKEICEYELGARREDIGIIAADRAQLYFKGKWRDVGLKEIDELVQYGTDMLIIEKEGVAVQLALFADEKGIALLNTRGFLVEYASILSEKSEEEGCNIAILTDLDASGLLLARDAPMAYRVGIDFDTLDDLELDINVVQEKYDPKNHLAPFEEDGEHAGIYSDEIINYISKKRIEINSVIAALDDNRKFWEWIIQKLREEFPERNYNRSVDIPEYVMPECLEELNDIVKKMGIDILEKPREKLQNLLSNINNGFLFDRTNRVLSDMNITKYEQAIRDQSRKIIENNESIKPLLEKVENLLLSNEDNEDNNDDNDDTEKHSKKGGQTN